MSDKSHDVVGFNNTSSYRFQPIIYPRDRLNNNQVYVKPLPRYEPTWWHQQASSTSDDLKFLLARTELKFTVAQP